MYFEQAYTLPRCLTGMISKATAPPSATSTMSPTILEKFKKFRLLFKVPREYSVTWGYFDPAAMPWIIDCEGYRNSPIWWGVPFDQTAYLSSANGWAESIDIHSRIEGKE